MIDDCGEPFFLTSDRYQIRAGLRALDRPALSIGPRFERYRSNKLAARAERFEKYVQFHQLDDVTRRRVQLLLIDRLTDQRQHVNIVREDDAIEVACNHTGDRLRFSAAGDLLDTEPIYADGIDALAMQFEEDLAIVRRSDMKDWLAAVHLCAPNHWAAEDKVGRPFEAVHEPVADIDPINHKAAQWVDMMIHATPGLQREAWGIATDDILNRHPANSADASPPRRFDPDHPRAFLRIERQAMLGLPDVDAAVFLIRTTFVDLNHIRADADQCERLIGSLESMSEATVRYKGLAAYRDDLVRWLNAD